MPLPRIVYWKSNDATDNKSERCHARVVRYVAGLRYMECMGHAWWIGEGDALFQLQHVAVTASIFLASFSTFVELSVWWGLIHGDWIGCHLWKYAQWTRQATSQMIWNGKSKTTKTESYGSCRCLRQIACSDIYLTLSTNSQTPQTTWWDSFDVQWKVVLKVRPISSLA